ncbi:unnamed protein product [Aphis gossypii]|uniref:Uncharacterized protein n=1 Tax=Aphis gossypii TaxID=80765 RepID=A0A9P0IQ42_APHGO|nr:unnamed protein product [Aphis gossypii]
MLLLLIYTRPLLQYTLHILLLLLYLGLDRPAYGTQHAHVPLFVRIVYVCTLCVYNNNNGTLFRTYIYTYAHVYKCARKHTENDIFLSFTWTRYNILRFLDSCFIDVNSPTDRHTPHIRRSLAPRIALLHVLDVPPNHQPQTRFLCIYIYIMKNILINDRKWPTPAAKRIPTYGRVFVTFIAIL